jgi:beta-glucanase (GH16 family)
VHGTIHTEKYNHMIGTQKGGSHLLNGSSNPEEKFHVYRIDWYPDKMVFSVDEKEYFVYQNEGKGYEQWPFDQPMYLILNLAYGGNWGGLRGLEPDKLPQKMEIDYVRVYQNK